MINATVGLDQRSIDLRVAILNMVASAGRGHIGPAFSLVEILRVLYDHVLRFDAQEPRWPERDRFLLSKGHGCLALYVLLADKGFFPRSELLRFCKRGSFLAGHPVHEIPGVEASTGSLGHGLPIGVGLALAARMSGRSYRTYVVVGDGESDEGSVWEAAMHASKHRLGSLTVITDYNKNQSYGPTREVLDLEPLVDKWRACGFSVAEVDGHDVAALRAVFSAAPREPSRPTAVICHTVKGRGISVGEGNPAWHHHSKIASADVEAWVEELRAGA